MIYSARKISNAPENLVVDGEYQLGCFDSPVKHANLLDIHSSNNFMCSRICKSFGLREWQAFQIRNLDTFVMIAIYNAKKISLVQFIVYNLKTKRKVKYEKKVLGWELSIPDTLYDSSASYCSNNFSILVKHDLNTNKLEIDVNICGFEDLPNVKANFKGFHDTSRYTPMVVCNPFSADSAMYSHKCLMPAEGSLVIGEERVSFDRAASQLIIDDHKGYYPYVTVYDWVTGLGVTADQRLIGFNLTRNQVVEQDMYNENCLWLDGVLHPLPPVKIRRPDGYKGTWYVTDEHDMVKLEFTPVTHTSVNLNYLVIASKYEGPYGYYSGYLRTADGGKVVIDNLFGMGEDFYLRT